MKTEFQNNFSYRFPFKPGLHDLGATAVNGHHVDMFIEISDTCDDCFRVDVISERQGKDASELICDETLEVVNAFLRRLGFDLKDMSFTWLPKGEQCVDVVQISFAPKQYQCGNF